MCCKHEHIYIFLSIVFKPMYYYQYVLIIDSYLLILLWSAFCRVSEARSQVRSSCDPEVRRRPSYSSHEVLLVNEEFVLWWGLWLLEFLLWCAVRAFRILRGNYGCWYLIRDFLHYLDRNTSICFVNIAGSIYLASAIQVIWIFLCVYR